MFDNSDIDIELRNEKSNVPMQKTVVLLVMIMAGMTIYIQYRGNKSIIIK